MFSPFSVATFTTYTPFGSWFTFNTVEEGKKSTCPIKGEASYWMPKEATPNYFAWSYETPNPQAKKIAGYIAFNMDYITFISAPI